MATRAGKTAAVAIAGLVCLCVFVLAPRGQRPTLAAMASAQGMLAVTSNLGEDSLLYLVDHDEKKLLVFLVSAQRKSLRLLAVRNYTWDFRMDVLNNEGLLPETVKANVTGQAEAPKSNPRRK